MEKYRLSDAEVALLVEGVEALARENSRMAEDARRLGHPDVARSLLAKANSARTLASTARSVRIQRITVRY